MHVITITTAFPETEKSPAGWFILKTLQKMRIDLDVIVPAHDSDTYENLIPGGTVHWARYAPRRLSLLNTSKNFGGIPVNLRIYPWLIFLVPFMMFFMLVKTWKVTKKDSILHAHWLPNGLIGAIIKKIKGNPFILTFRGSDEKLLKISIIRPLVYWILHSAEAITTVSQRLKNQIEHYFKMGHKTYFIPNGVDIPPLKLREGNKIFKLLYVGALIQRKGIPDLINAIAQIEHKSRLLLDIVGSGVEFDKLVKLVNDSQLADVIRFLGPISPLQVQAKMMDSDCLVLPTYFEGTPNVVKEAMACGLPVISTYAGGIPELITHGEQGLLFHSGDVDTLELHIEFLSTHRDEAQRMGLKGRQFIVENNLTWKVTADCYLELYRKVISTYA